MIEFQNSEKSKKYNKYIYIFRKAFDICELININKGE